jgi:predicted nucleic acid-binding protein
VKEKVFTDTNILIYHFTREPLKYDVTDAIITSSNLELVTSTKVLSEFANICLRKKLVKSNSEIKNHIEAISKLFIVAGLTKEDILMAMEIQKYFKISFYDSLIVASAVNAGCEKLYTEDMHHGLFVRKKMKIVNPFR